MADASQSRPPAVAVVGMVGRFPGANDVEEFWRNLRAGEESVRPLADDEIDVTETGPEALQDPHYIKMASVLDDIELFDPEFFGFTQREAEITDPQHRVFLECAWQALEHAGYDVRRFDGAVGVYGGSGSNGYLRSHLMPHRSLVRSVGMMQLGLGNDKDYLTTRVSYKLDLKGPSVNVQTACSTSLVAVHLACQGLLSYECDLALAGGVSIGVPQNQGYFYTPDGIASPDGHCRSFDADAAGTIFGSGAGVVVLKRLEEAEEDGDTIYAVLRGSAINNDGAVRAGFTAPGVDGQAGVISEAFAAAEIDPATVGYVEAHGTATPLGDPIEVAALTEVFRAASSNGRCALGSVKTNFGHLDTAAGVTGLIKTVLSLHNGEIPPSLHFRSPNPQIDFDQGPFYVNTELSRWQSNGNPRRAAVSSFGIGGSNAHVVLEEAPPSAGTSSSRAVQLLPLSARSTEALDRAAENLAGHLEQSPSNDLADIAYTLQVGRRHFEHRGFAICGTTGEAITELRAGLVRHTATPSPPPVVFLFPGQGAQYPNMGRELYNSEPEYRRHVDECAEILKPHLGLDLRELLHPAGAVEGARRQLEQTAMTQPALFVVEYALARLWMSWGVTPRAMLGHSIGEWVAACLAGVFSLEDALALVAERGRRMQEMPRGAMLSVPLSEDELVAELSSSELAIAALNGPGMSVVSGPEEAIQAFEQELAGRGLETRRLHTSHAFHSPGMAAMVEPFVNEVARRQRQAPSVPFLSNLTGDWISDQDAVDPTYWGRQLLSAVRFSAGLETVLAEDGTVLLEVGPGHSLATLARRQPACGVAISSLRRPNDEGSDVAGLLSALGRLWLTGVEADWQAFSADEQRRRVPLPTYPFDRRRCWIDPPARSADAPTTVAADESEDVAGLASPAASDAAAARKDSLSARPRPLLGVAYAEPRDDLERTVVDLWQDLLGVEPVGADDDFFELGGHSLLATQLVTLIRKSTGADLPMRQLFEAPTPSQLATLIRERRGLPAETLEELPAVTPDRDNLHQPFPLTDVQQAYWIGRSGDFELGGVATHTYMEIDSKNLDLERFTAAWQRVIDRHSTLRTIFEGDGRQRVLEDVPRFSIPVLDLRDHDAEAAERRLAEERDRLSHQVLPSDQWPLFGVRATRLGENRWRVHLSYDFLLGDAWSWRILFEELQLFYGDPQAELPPLELSFRDCVLAEIAFRDSQTYRRALDYWHRRLPELPPGPDLPLAKNPAEIDKPRFVRRTAKLPADTWQKVKERGSRAGLTPSGVLLAAFAEVLSVWSESPRFTLNLTLFHRPPFHPQVNDVIGDFTSLVLLTADAGAGDTFEARARHIQQRLWEDLDHRWVSGVQVQRDLAKAQGRVGANAMPVVFTSTLHIADDTGAVPSAEEAEAATGDNQQVFSISQTPQVWIDHQVGEEAGVLGFNWDVVEEIFPDGMVQEMFDAYCDLLERLADDENQWVQGRQASVQALLGTDAVGTDAVSTDTAPQAVPEGLLHQPFLTQAESHPDRPAVIAPQRTLTYGELEQQSRALAIRLQSLGVEPNRLVAVVMDKGWEQVVAVLAILRAGAAYLPINASLPAKRIAYLLEDGEVEVALTQPWVEDNMDWPEGVHHLVVDGTPGHTLEDQGELASPVTSPEDLAYVIFTSGSTGRPKGVMIDHRGALNTCVDVNQRFAVGPEDRVLALSSLSFDLSVWDVFGVLAAGGAVVLPEPEAQREPERWAQLMREHRVTLWNSVPALMEMLVESLEGDSTRVADSLRLVMLSGDWIPVSLPGRLRELSDEVELISLGGATEASIWSILYPIHDVDPDWPSIPYGRAMTHQSFHVLDHALQPRPPWVPGELYIGGIGLAKGYWRDPDKTAVSFIRHPDSGEPLYRTGDLGRLLPDGNIEFLGRRDSQVKLRGHRIELGEVEAVLVEHPAVRAAVAVLQKIGTARGATQLVAACVPEPGGEMPDAEALRAFAADRLPDYMVPTLTFPIEAVPLTANGKVDRSAVAEAATEQATPATEDRSLGDGAPRSETEAAVLTILSEVLGNADLGIGDNFFEAGGDSLLATRATYRIRRELGIELAVANFFEAETVAELAAAVAEQAGDEEVPTTPLAETSNRASEQQPTTEKPTVERQVATSPAPPVFSDPVFWRSLEIRGRQRARQLSKDDDVATEAADEPRVDALSAAYVSAALRRLGLYAEAGERHTFDQLVERGRVIDRHRKALRRWLEMLTEDGLLEHHDGTWTSPQPLPEDSFRDLATRSEGHLSPEVLVNLITGEQHALELLIPDESAQELGGAYRQAPMFRYCNEICELLTDEIVAALPPDRPLRILEIGAGTGGTTASLLPLLPTEGTEYVYTDVSKFFTDLGQKKFAEFPFLSFAELDIESDPGVQGFDLGSFDLIVAAHVLHATRRVTETLNHVRSLLRPQGLLMLLEETRFRRLFNFSMGFLPGFDRFDDAEWRLLHPLLSADDWRKALLAHGFEEVMNFTEPGSAADVLGVDVLIARAEEAELPAPNQVPADVIPRRDERHWAPLSFAQERLWAFENRHPGTACYNVSNRIRIHGALDADRFERAFMDTVRSQNALLTAFGNTGFGPHQTFDTGATLACSKVDLSSLSEETAAERAKELMTAEAHQAFDLDQGPPARALLLRFDERKHFLHLTLHHLMIDGLSLPALARELADRYAALGGGNTTSALVIEYGDFAAWQHQRLASGELDDTLAFWRRQLRDVQAFELPGRKPSTTAGFDRVGVPVELAPELAAGLRTLAGSQRTTLSMVLLAALGVLFHRATGAQRIPIATPFAHRDREELQGLAGMLIYMLPLPIDLTGDPTFRDLITRARDTAAAAYAHPELPFGRLASERGALSSTLGCPVMFNMPMAAGGHAPATQPTAGVTFEPLASVEMGIEFDLSVYAVDGAGGLELHLTYRQDLFEQATIEELARDFADLLANAIGDPERKVSRLAD